MKHVRDLPTDPAQIESEADAFFEDAAMQIETVSILGQLDPTETVAEGENIVPRWTAEQQRAILLAREVFEGWSAE